MSDKTNVETMHDFKNLDAADLHSGMNVYSYVERQVDSLKASVATWLLDYAKTVQEECDNMPSVTLSTMEAALLTEIAYITDETKAGGFVLTGAQCKLTGRNSLAAAWKKIRNGLEKGLDLREFTSVSAIAIESARINKTEIKQEQDNKEAAEIANWAQRTALETGFDLDSENGKAEVRRLTTVKLLAINALKGVTNANPDETAGESVESANVSIDTVLMEEFGIAIPEYLKIQAALVVDRMDQLKAEALNLLINKALIMSGASNDDKAAAAFDQLMQGIEAQSTKWLTTAKNHRDLAVANGFIIDDDEEEDLQATG